MSSSSDEEDSLGQYNDSNRAFLQAFLARGTLTLAQAKPILAAIFTVSNPNEPTSTDDVTQEDFDSYISAAANALSPFDYEIRSTYHQITKERIWALVNTTSDAMTQLATTRSNEEVAFVKRILDAIFEGYNSKRMEVMAVTSMQALKAAKAPARRDQEGSGNEGAEKVADKGLTQTQAEQTLRSLVAEGWFEHSRNGFHSLSPRALLELRSWLVNSYNTADEDDDEEVEWQRIKFCEACKEIVTVGQRCAEPDCGVRLHDICADAYWRTHPARKCTRCGTDWLGKNFVGERAVTETEAYLRGRRRSGGNRNRAEPDPELAADEAQESE
jgi:hypothetical protein